MIEVKFLETYIESFKGIQRKRHAEYRPGDFKVCDNDLGEWLIDNKYAVKVREIKDIDWQNGVRPLRPEKKAGRPKKTIKQK